jgi:carboxypeptidase C (cathepsin A)
MAIYSLCCIHGEFVCVDLGPCNIDGPNGTKFNPHGWNQYANIIFVDQPVDVGFSYAEHGYVVR